MLVLPNWQKIERNLFIYLIMQCWVHEWHFKITDFFSGGGAKWADTNVLLEVSKLENLEIVGFECEIKELPDGTPSQHTRLKEG